MREFSEERLIDMFEQIDISLLDIDDIEQDLENSELCQETKKWNKRKIAVITGIAAGSVAITGAAIYFLRKSSSLKKAA